MEAVGRMVKAGSCGGIVNALSHVGLEFRMRGGDLR